MPPRATQAKKSKKLVIEVQCHTEAWMKSKDLNAVFVKNFIYKFQPDRVIVLSDTLGCEAKSFKSLRRRVFRVSDIAFEDSIFVVFPKQGEPGAAEAIWVLVVHDRKTQQPRYLIKANADDKFPGDPAVLQGTGAQNKNEPLYVEFCQGIGLYEALVPDGDGTAADGDAAASTTSDDSVRHRTLASPRALDEPGSKKQKLSPSSSPSSGPATRSASRYASSP